MARTTRRNSCTTCASVPAAISIPFSAPTTTRRIRAICISIWVFIGYAADGSIRLGLRERIARVGGQAFGLGQAQLLAHEVGAENHRHHLVGGVAPTHALAPHAAIRRD